MTRKRMPARFYCNINGIEPVREWLLSIDKRDRALIGQDIKTVEYGWPIGMPTCRSMGGGLWEVRSNLSNGKNCPSAFLLSFRKPNTAPWVYEKDPENTKNRFRFGEEAKARGGKCLTYILAHPLMNF